MILGLFRKSLDHRVIDRLHGEIMAAARQPALFLDFGVADTFEGRFEIFTLIATVPVRRLAQLPALGAEMAQKLTDAVFTHFDDALREMGTSDVGVPKRIKQMASSWLGRRAAYAAALDATGTNQLAVAIARNVHGDAFAIDSPKVESLANYIFELEAAHAKCDLETYLKGPAPFPAVGFRTFTP
jgi:cytochrome b pre-mRNA-processing protein 3